MIFPYYLREQKQGGSAGRPERSWMLYLVHYEVTMGVKKIMLTDIVEAADKADAMDEAGIICWDKKVCLRANAADVVNVRPL